MPILEGPAEVTTIRKELTTRTHKGEVGLDTHRKSNTFTLTYPGRAGFVAANRQRVAAPALF